MVMSCHGHVIISFIQCGFKLLTRSAAQRLFPVYHVERWYVCVCCEVLYIIVLILSGHLMWSCYILQNS